MPLPRIPEQVDAQQLKSQVDLIDVVGGFVSLSRVGSIVRGSCPFHDESTPSFTVYSDHFYCYGCRSSGDIYSFLMKKLNITFPEALQWLRERVGTIEPVKVSIKTSTIPVPVIPEIVEMYHGMLRDKHRAYYHSRLINDATISRELLGWSGTAMTIPVWEGRPQESECLGVRYRNTGRNGPRYYGLRGSNVPQLYNSWVLHNEPGAFVVFGEFDALLATQRGLPTVSPTNGCASWDASWDCHFDGKEGIILIPDFGEERFAHKLAEHLGQTRCRVLNLFSAEEKDFTDWSLAGHKPAELLERLQEQYSQQVVEYDF